MHNRYAFFDVDGTVIVRDSFMLLAVRVLKRAPWRCAFLVALCPVFALTALFPLDKRFAKSCMLWSLTVFRGRRQSVRLLSDVLRPLWPDLWFNETGMELARLRSEGVHVCYVSASGQTWLRSLLSSQDPGPKTIIGSRLGFFLGGVVMRSRNCYGAEKVRRIEERLGAAIHWWAGYSDHTADVPMLARCSRRYLISPKEKHARNYGAAFGDGFEILHWHARHPPAPVRPADIGRPL